MAPPRAGSEIPAGAPLRYLSAADVAAAMPPLAERLVLAERTLAAIGTSADLPPKIGVHPRSPGSFGHAMPAFLRGGDPSGGDDRLGMKWVTGSPGNAARGLPAIAAIVVLNDPATGRPIAILDGAPITAQRTAAVSGVAIARLAAVLAAPAGGAADGPPANAVRVALLGAGVQGHAHLPVLAALLPGATLVIADRHADRAAAVAEAADAMSRFGRIETAIDLVSAVDGAGVVVSTLSFGPERQLIPAGAFAAASLVVAVDYDMTVPAAVATTVERFLVDEAAAFVANRDAGLFRDYPDPTGTLGDVVRGPLEAGAIPGRSLVTHLGVGLADVVFGSAILERAEAAGLGTALPG